MKYYITIERPAVKYWRGVKVPFIVMVRLHHPAGSRIWFNLIGPDFFKWSQKIALKDAEMKLNDRDDCDD